VNCKWANAPPPSNALSGESQLMRFSKLVNLIPSDGSLIILDKSILEMKLILSVNTNGVMRSVNNKTAVALAGFKVKRNPINSAKIQF